MIASRLRPIRALLIGSILVVGQVAAATAATPDPENGATLTAEPAVITADVQAGDEVSETLTLRAQQALDITIEPMGLGQSPVDGSFTYLSAEDDTGPYTARDIIEVSPSELHMEPGTL